MDRRQDRAKDIRNNATDRHRDLFSDRYWDRHPVTRHARWHYHGGHHWGHWWRWATWRGITGWVAWSWNTPVYYDYGAGGNVYYEGDTVYVNDEEYCSADEYAQQAVDIAASAPEPPEEDVEWMPLGVFALTHEEKGDANMMVQLVVSKEGIIAGTYTNTLTDASEGIEGMVDRETQRAAWTIGDNKSTVLETGVYNLTQDETPVLVHFDGGKTQTWLMVRLDPPEGSEAQE